MFIIPNEISVTFSYLAIRKNKNDDKCRFRKIKFMPNGNSEK